MYSIDLNIKVLVSTTSLYFFPSSGHFKNKKQISKTHRNDEQYIKTNNKRDLWSCKSWRC